MNITIIISPEKITANIHDYNVTFVQLFKNKSQVPHPRGGKGLGKSTCISELHGRLRK